MILAHSSVVLLVSINFSFDFDGLLIFTTSYDVKTSRYGP